MLSVAADPLLNLTLGMRKIIITNDVIGCENEICVLFVHNMSEVISV